MDIDETRLDEVFVIIRTIYNSIKPDTPGDLIRTKIASGLCPTINERKIHAEISTPTKLVNTMLSCIPSEFWTIPSPVLDPCCGKGNFVLGIFDAFFIGLAERIPDITKRCDIIIHNCIYMSDINPANIDITSYIMMKHIFHTCGEVIPCSTMNTYIGDALSLDIKSVWGIDMSNMTVIGNPPYSTNLSNRHSIPLYDKFIDAFISSRYLLFIVPSRWFSGGRGLSKFRYQMIHRRDIMIIEHEDNASKWFEKGSNIVIKGGVNYFLKNSDYSGDCLFNGVSYPLSKYDCVIKPKYHSAIDAIIALNLMSIETIYKGRSFGIETNDNRLDDIGNTKCFVSKLKSNLRHKYIREFEFTDENTYWKVITVEAFDKEFSGFGDIFIGNPYEVHTGTYISFIVASEFEALSLQSYLQTSFANYMLSIRKISQHIHKDTLKWIPLLPLDRIWNHDMVCDYLRLDSNLFIICNE